MNFINEFCRSTAGNKNGDKVTTAFFFHVSREALVLAGTVVNNRCRMRSISNLHGLCMAIERG